MPSSARKKKTHSFQEHARRRKSALHKRIFFFNHTATTEIYTLSLHDALPISPLTAAPSRSMFTSGIFARRSSVTRRAPSTCSRCAERSEEHTSELQSLAY